MEMTWDWLLQIFMGEGEVIDVYVSQKRRKNNDCWFGFIRFKKLEETRSAVRNLNGVKIREKSLKVSFAKYHKKGMPWNGPLLQESKIGSEMVGREEKCRKVTINGRSFKEAMEGSSSYQKIDDWVMENPRRMAESDADKNRIKLDKHDLEEVKRKLGVVIDETINTIQRDKDTMVASLDCTKEIVADGKKGGVAGGIP